jgi:hypothetical protein
MKGLSNGELEILKRLNVMIAISLEQSGGKTAGGIRKLSEMGLSVADISQILGKPSNYVSATLRNNSRKRRK